MKTVRVMIERFVIKDTHEFEIEIPDDEWNMEDQIRLAVYKHMDDAGPSEYEEDDARVIKTFRVKDQTRTINRILLAEEFESQDIDDMWIFGR